MQPALTLNSLHNQLITKARERGLDISPCISAGDLHATIAFVSTSPGATEIRTGIPYSGGAGKLLWDTSRSIRITRNDVYITNVIKSAVNAREDHERKALTAGIFGIWSELVKWELAQLPNLRYLLLLGGEALTALTGKSGILHERGSWLKVQLNNREVDAIATINPAMVIRCQKMLSGEKVSPYTEWGTTPPLRAAAKIFSFDLTKFRMLLDGKLTRYTLTCRINPTLEEALSYINRCALSPNPVSLDIETTNQETACIGLAISSTDGMCIPFVSNNLKPYWSAEDELTIRLAICRFLETQKKIVAQNGMFDTAWLWFKDKIKGKIWYDTLLAHHTLYPGLPHSLEFLCSRYTTHPYYKSEKDDWRSVGDINRFWRYNVTDCCITLAVQEATLHELKQAKLDDFFFNHVMRIQPHLCQMVVGGIKVDNEYKRHVKDSLEIELATLLENFYAAVHTATGDSDYNPSPRSVPDRADLLFTRLKLVGRGTSTDKANVQRMANHYKTSPEAKNALTALTAYTKAHKFYSVYASSAVDEDGRARTEYKQFGTQQAPGRLSSSKTPWGTGSNLQNIPHQAYPMFVCGDDYCFIYFDLEQAEARVVGWIANIPKWIEDFERARSDGSYDCHRALASDLWGMRYEDVPTKDIGEDGKHSLRYIAKRVRHGANYRMQAQKLAEVTGLSNSLASDAFNRYHKVNPQLRQWWKRTEETAIKDKMLYNLYGRRWVLTEIVTDQTLESIVAFVPQSTIGDKVNRVIYMAHEDDDWPSDARICLNIHDALVGLAPIAKADHCLKILKKHAEEPLHVAGQIPLIIPAATKKTKQKTAWSVIDGKVVFYNSEQGYHRWSDLSTVELR